MDCVPVLCSFKLNRKGFSIAYLEPLPSEVSNRQSLAYFILFFSSSFIPQHFTIQQCPHPPSTNSSLPAKSLLSLEPLPIAQSSATRSCAGKWRLKLRKIISTITDRQHTLTKEVNHPSLTIYLLLRFTPDSDTTNLGTSTTDTQLYQ
jgi:hypothetical protein